MNSYEQNCNAPQDAFHDARFVRSCATDAPRTKREKVRQKGIRKWK